MAGQLWVTNSLGGYFYSLNLSDELRTAVQPMTKFRQFASVKDASQQGQSKGNTYTWDTVLDVATAGTNLVETSTMPETNFTIVQGTLTIDEAGVAVPYTGKLEALSKFAAREPIMKSLRNDATKYFDGKAYDQFNLCALRVARRLLLCASQDTPRTGVCCVAPHATHRHITGPRPPAPSPAHPLALRMPIGRSCGTGRARPPAAQRGRCAVAVGE